MSTVIIATICTFLAVPILGALLGLAQLGIYRALVRAGKMTTEQIPFFGALLFRGMMLVMALGVVAAIAANIAGGPRT